jgi:hypothetical protein
MLTTESAARKDMNTAKYGVELQHRHFSFIAAVIAEMPKTQRPEIADRFATACAGSNPRFDRRRFMTACGL